MQGDYFYSAAVQGVQGIIFQSNKLKDITASSNIVEDICDKTFHEFLNNEGINIPENQFITTASGKIQVLCNEEQAKTIVREYSKVVLNEAPGITFSQTVVSTKDKSELEVLQESEDNLRIQRNKATTQHGLGWMSQNTYRPSGLPALLFEGEREKRMDAFQERRSQYWSKADPSKTGMNYDSLLSKMLGESYLGIIGKEDNLSKMFPIETDQLAKKSDKEWVAVIHADGNNIGRKIILLGKKVAENKPDSVLAAYKDFSERMERATWKALQVAFRRVVYPLKFETEQGEGHYPIRPCIIGGDDITLVIRGDLAFSFTSEYLQAFEKSSREEFKDFDKKFGLDNYFSKGFSACAGIAFIKPHYPFHYGVSLADELCKVAKKNAKSIDKENRNDLNQHTPSCLMFHAVHSSFIDDFSEIKSRELEVSVRGDKIKPLSFANGPYYLNEQMGKPTINQMKVWLDIIEAKKELKSGVRKLLGEIRINPDAAEMMYDRLLEIHSEKTLAPLHLAKIKEWLKNPPPKNDSASDSEANDVKTHLYDLVTLSNVINA